MTTNPNTLDIIKAAHIAVRSEDEWTALARQTNHYSTDPDEVQEPFADILQEFIRVADAVRPVLETLGYQVTDGHENGAIININGEDVFHTLNLDGDDFIRDFDELLDEYRRVLNAA